jgi:hypothetical protein
MRARAAVERRTGNYENASMLIEQALSRLDEAPRCGARRYEIDRLLDLRNTDTRLAGASNP